jgi:hypothetical protein
MSGLTFQRSQGSTTHNHSTDRIALPGLIRNHQQAHAPTFVYSWSYSWTVLNFPQRTILRLMNGALNAPYSYGGADGRQQHGALNAPYGGLRGGWTAAARCIECTLRRVATAGRTCG